MIGSVAAMAIDRPRIQQTRHYIGEWLTHLGWTQDRLAEAMGVHKSTVSRYVRNVRGLKLAELGLVASVLDLQAADLLEDPSVFSAARALRQLQPDQISNIEQTIHLLQKKS